AAVHDHAKYFAYPRSKVLHAFTWPARRSAVAHANVQIAIRPEWQLAAVTVREGLRDPQQDLRGRGVGTIRIDRRHAIARDHGGSRSYRLGVVDVEEAVLLVLRMEGDAEQSALVAAEDEVRDVEKRRRQDARAVPD